MKFGDKHITAESITKEYLSGMADPIEFTDKEFHEYMTHGPGRFANASQMDLVDNFFLGELLGTKGTGEKQEYSLREAVIKFGDVDSKLDKLSDAEFFSNSKDDSLYYEKKHAHNTFKDILTQSDFKDKGGHEWAERTYIFQSQSYSLNKNVKFVIDEEGHRSIENFAIMAHGEDFDFRSSSFFTSMGNAMIKDEIDPKNEGKAVEFVYPASGINAKDDSYLEKYGTTYTFKDFMQDKERYGEQNHGTYLELNTPMDELVNRLKEQKNIDNPKTVTDNNHSTKVESKESEHSKELIESCMVSNEVVEMLARENERPVTTMIREMQESAANANESYVGRTLYDDYDGMD